MSFALDRATNTLFVPVGNPGPDFNEAVRPGPNLFTDSLVALDASTGKLKWWHQLLPNDEHVHQFDIIVTSTASTLPIIGKGTLERVMKQRQHAPVFIVDLAVPRDVEAEAAQLDDVFLYSVDDLAAIVKDNLQIRKEAVVQAEQMIAEQTAHFLRWLKGRSMVPTIAALNRHYDALRQAELERAKRLLQNGTSPEQALEALARGITSKLLHAPLAAVHSAGDAERVELLASLQRVYKLPQTGES